MSVRSSVCFVLLKITQAFVTAVPSQEDGKDTILRPRVYRVAIAYRLGLPVLSNEIPCPLCMQPINVYGDHATCCAKNGDLITRHNSLRNLVDRIANDGLLESVLEKKGILGNTPGRRPGDVTIKKWESDRALAIDVAVTSPLTKTSMRLINPCEEYSASRKHRKYDVSFEGTDYAFCAMVFETLGAINAEGEEVLCQIFRYAAKNLGKEFTSYCSRAWARVSCCLQRSVGQSILNRIDGFADVRKPQEVHVEGLAADFELVPVLPEHVASPKLLISPEVPKALRPVVLLSPAAAPFLPRLSTPAKLLVPPEIPPFPKGLSPGFLLSSSSNVSSPPAPSRPCFSSRKNFSYPGHAGGPSLSEGIQRKHSR